MYKLLAMLCYANLPAVIGFIAGVVFVACKGVLFDELHVQSIHEDFHMAFPSGPRVDGAVGRQHRTVRHNDVQLGELLRGVPGGKGEEVGCGVLLQVFLATLAPARAKVFGVIAAAGFIIFVLESVFLVLVAVEGVEVMGFHGGRAEVVECLGLVLHVDCLVVHTLMLRKAFQFYFITIQPK